MKKIHTFLAAMAAAAIVLASPAYADEGVDTSRFVPGTRVNGIGIGNMTVDEAAAQIEGFYAGEYQLSIKGRDGASDTIKGTDIDYKVAVPAGLAAILEAQNASGRNAGPSADNAHSLTMTASYNEEKLSAVIQGLPCLSGSGIITTSDARISDYREGEAYTIIPAVQGNDLDLEKTKALITEAVKTGSTSVDLDSAGCYRQVQVWETSEEIKKLCDTMNGYRTMSVRYLFGDQSEVLDGGTICSWITGSTDGKAVFDQEKAAAYIQGLAAVYDTAGTTRTFHTALGADVALTGPYGWKIDVAGESQALLALLAEGPSEKVKEREPLYALEAASRTGSDWGTTYVEVDLIGQHVYAFKDGALVWDAPCVTGNISKNYTTPPGIYSLTYKEKDRILRGAKKADGTYEYESHVDYWMPFNGGIGLHDAAWRNKFGGTIYQTSGSHGCVNLPPAQVPALYEFVYKGIPVICHGA